MDNRRRTHTTQKKTETGDIPRAIFLHTIVYVTYSYILLWEDM